MKQKVLIKVTMCCPEKCRVKAMKIAATSDGVESVALKGADKDQIEVIGEGIDTVELAKLINKHVGRADLVSVAPFKQENNQKKVDEKKKDEKKDAAAAAGVPIYNYINGYVYPPPPPHNYYYYAHAVPACYEYEPYREPSCSIL